MEPLIDTNTDDLLTAAPSTIWDIENAEKLQFIAFIQDKIDAKFSKMVDYYKQQLLSLKEEHSKQLVQLQTELDETRQHVCHLQDKLTMHENFILIGWYTSGYEMDQTECPIMVPFNLTDSTFDKYMTRYNKHVYIKLVLSQLYKTSLRNVNLLNIMVTVSGGLERHITMVDEELNILLKKCNWWVDIGEFASGKIAITRESYFRQNKETFRMIERNYPGLFYYPEHLKCELI